MGDTFEDLVERLRQLVQPAPPPRRTKKVAGYILGTLVALAIAAFGHAVWKVPTMPGPEFANPE